MNLNPFDIARIMGSGVGPELIQTLKRIAEKQGMGIDEVMQQSLAFTKRMEDLAARSGKSVACTLAHAAATFVGSSNSELTDSKEATSSKQPNR